MAYGGRSCAEKNIGGEKNGLGSCLRRLGHTCGHRCCSWKTQLATISDLVTTSFDFQVSRYVVINCIITSTLQQSTAFSVRTRHSPSPIRLVIHIHMYLTPFLRSRQPFPLQICHEVRSELPSPVSFLYVDLAKEAAPCWQTVALRV